MLASRHANTQLPGNRKSSYLSWAYEENGRSENRHPDLSMSVPLVYGILDTCNSSIKNVRSHVCACACKEQTASLRQSYQATEIQLEDSKSQLLSVFSLVKWRARSDICGSRKHKT